jgi:hypothetical protein
MESKRCQTGRCRSVQKGARCEAQPGGEPPGTPLAPLFSGFRRVNSGARPCAETVLIGHSRWVGGAWGRRGEVVGAVGRAKSAAGAGEAAVGVGGGVGAPF